MWSRSGREPSDAPVPRETTVEDEPRGTGPCHLCGSASTEILVEVETGAIDRCRDCETVYRANLVTGRWHRELYQDPATMHSPFYLANKLASDPRSEPIPTYRKGLRRLAELAPAGRLLDVGCSYGAFLQLAEQHGWEAHGVELSAGAAEFARRERGLRVTEGALEQTSFPDAYFQAVTMWDVIEHLEDPLSTLRVIKRILAPGGILLVFTINQESLLNLVGHALYRLSFERWGRLMMLFYDIHHNFFFSRGTLRNLLRRSGGLDVVDVDFAPARVRRWRTVPISPLLIAGSDAIDAVAKVVGRQYRMSVYCRRVA